MIEGSGFVPLINGSGSGLRRPENIQIRIHNSVPNSDFTLYFYARRLPAGNPARHASADQDGRAQHLRHFAEVLRQTVRGSARRKGRNGDVHPGRVSLPDTPPSAEEGHQEQEVVAFTGQAEAQGGDFFLYFLFVCSIAPSFNSELGFFSLFQCSGSMTFWGGSGSGSSDPCFWLMDPDPAIFVIDLQDASNKLIFNTIFSAYYFLKVHLHHFSKIKSHKESQNRRNQGFSYYFCMMIEGSGSIPLTSGSWSGSGRPKNMWIRNTALFIDWYIIL